MHLPSRVYLLNTNQNSAILGIAAFSIYQVLLDNIHNVGHPGVNENSSEVALGKASILRGALLVSNNIS